VAVVVEALVVTWRPRVDAGGSGAGGRLSLSWVPIRTRSLVINKNIGK
jgi:hypothetical protein